MDIIKMTSLVIVVLLCISASGGSVSAASQDDGVPTHPPTPSEDSESSDSTDSDDSDSTEAIPETTPEPPEESSAGTVQLDDDTHDELKAGGVAVAVCGASLVVSGGGGCGAWAVAGYVGSQVVDSDNELKEDE